MHIYNTYIIYTYTYYVYGFVLNYDCEVMMLIFM